MKTKLLSVNRIKWRVKPAMTIVALFLVFAVHAQKTEFQLEWAFGVNGGVTFSQVDLMPKIPQNWLIQYPTGGLTARYISESQCGIQVELNYGLRGWEEEPDTVAHYYHYSRSLAYAELPVLTHFYFPTGKYARVVFNLGPQIGWYLNEKELGTREKIEGAPATATTPPNYPDYYDYLKVQNNFDYGLTGGLGLELRTGIGSFIVEGRYYYGLSDIFKNGKGDVFQTSHNTVIGVRLTYLTTFSRKRP